MIDICVNLTNAQFRDDADSVLARTAAAGVTGLLLTGTDLTSSRTLQQWITQRLPVGSAHCPALWSTAGIHPHDADTVDPDWQQQLRQLLHMPAVVAIGETGLDYARNFSSPANQRACFAAQAEMATALNIPLFVHDREASSDVLAILRGHHVKDAVIHCFTGTRQALEDYLEAGYYIGITGWVCDTRRGESLRELIAHIPDERLLIETDAPFLRPHNAPEEVPGQSDEQLTRRFRRRNEPALLPWIARSIAALRATTPSHIAEITTVNARRLFQLPAGD